MRPTRRRSLAAAGVGLAARLRSPAAGWRAGLLPGLLCLLTLAGCVRHLRVPPADLRDPAPVKPADSLSYLGASLHLLHPQLAALLEPQLPPPFAGTQSVGPLTLRYQVGRSGGVQLYADADGRLCVQQFLAGSGRIDSALYQHNQRLQAQLLACVRPVLDGAGLIRLQQPVVRVLVDRSGLTGPVGSLLEFLSDDLQQRASAWATQALGAMTVPTQPLLQPVLTRMQQPMALAQGACLRLRAQSVLLGQPKVEATGLVLAASVAAQPSVEQPCAVAGSAGPAPKLAVLAELRAPQTWLQLPIGVALQTLQAPLQSALLGRGKIALDAGWLRVLGVALQTSGGKLVARVAIDGEYRTKLLGFIPWNQSIRGQVLLLGQPVVERGGVRLSGLQVDVRSDSDLVEWAASLKRSDLLRLVDAHLRVSDRQLQDAANTALRSWSQQIDAGGVRLPVHVRVDELSLQRVAAAGQRLVAEVRFVGQLSVGEQPAKTAPTRPPVAR